MSSALEKEKLEKRIEELENVVESLKGGQESKRTWLAKLEVRVVEMREELTDLKDWVSKLDEEVNENNIFRRQITREDTEKVLPEKFKNKE